MFSIHPEYILLKRKIDENTIHSILYFFKKIQNLKKISKEIKYTLPSGDHIYIFEKGKFHKIGTYMFRILYNSSYNKKVEENYFPYGPMNKTPELVSFTEEKEWKHINLISILPKERDWEFYQLEWILQRWETALGFFDNDNFWSCPSYPSDLWNNKVHPDIILSYCKLYINEYSLDDLKINFFALYQFYKDKFSNDILQFFYEYVQNPVKSIDLYKKLHTLYHTTDKTNPYHLFLYYNNYSVVRSQFKINLFINQFLSYNGMFLCIGFSKDRKTSIFTGIQTRLYYFYPFIKNEDDLIREIEIISSFYGKNMSWIGKEHIESLETPFWKFIFTNWDSIPRNLFLWDNRSINYGDTQLMVGKHLTSIFPNEWTKNFYNKDYEPKKRLRKI